MWIVYRKSDHEVVGHSSFSAGKDARAATLEEIVGGLAEGGPVEDYDAVLVEDQTEALQLVAANPQTNRLTIENRSGTLKAAVKATERYQLQLTTDASEFHAVDGIALLPAGGETPLVVTVQKTSEQSAVTRVKDSDVVWLRTTHGEILDTAGKAVRSIRLDKGQATFHLRPPAARGVATVEVLCAAAEIENTQLKVEFT